VDPRTITAEDWMNREDEGILYVQRAGEMLYRLGTPDTPENSVS